MEQPGWVKELERLKNCQSGKTLKMPGSSAYNRTDAWDEKRLEAENQQYQKRYDRELSQWRIQLESYTHTLDEWKVQHNELSREKSKLTLYLIFGGLLAVMLIFTLLGIPLSLVPIYFMIRQYRLVEKLRLQLPPQPRPPKKPQPFDYESKLGRRPTLQTTPSVSLDIIPAWWQALEIQEQPERGYGLEGVSNLLEVLTKKLPDSFITFQELLVTQSLDADVLVLGPSGIWVLESKFWAWQVVCRKGTWYQVKDVYQRGGALDKKVTSYGINPDDQWLREQSMVTETLRRRVPEHPFLLKNVKGGLVFTHPEVELLIDNSCKVQWGKVDEWAERIKNTKPVKHFTSETQLDVADAILTFANIVDSASPSEIRRLHWHSASTIPPRRSQEICNKVVSPVRKQRFSHGSILHPQACIPKACILKYHPQSLHLQCLHPRDQFQPLMNQKDKPKLPRRRKRRSQR
jgi:hypothetical protein